MEDVKAKQDKTRGRARLAGLSKDATALALNGPQGQCLWEVEAAGCG